MSNYLTFFQIFFFVILFKIDQNSNRAKIRLSALYYVLHKFLNFLFFYYMKYELFMMMMMVFDDER